MQKLVFLSVLIAILASISSTWASPLFGPDADDAKFYGLPIFEKWHGGQQVTFRFRLDHKRTVKELFGDKPVTVVLERSRLGPNKEFDMLNPTIQQIGDKEFQVTATVPVVDKKANYKVKVKVGKESVAKSNYDMWKVWRWLYAPRRVRVDPVPLNQNQINADAQFTNY